MSEDKFTEDLGNETINFMKSSFKLAMDNAKLLQDQFEKLLNVVVDSAKSSGGEGTRIVENWMTVQKKGLEDYQKVINENLEEYKNIVDKNIQKIENFFKK